MTRAPGVVERLLMSRRASTSRCISYSDGCRGRGAIDDEKGTRASSDLWHLQTQVTDLGDTGSWCEVEDIHLVVPSFQNL